MREEIIFKSKGLQCRGWLYLPDHIESDMTLPAIVMAHGFSAVKEQALPEFAEKFSSAGFATLVFDYRFFGASEGEPRCQLFPLEMVEDYRNAISWVAEHPRVDRDRICIWGTSYCTLISTQSLGYRRQRVPRPTGSMNISNSLDKRSYAPQQTHAVRQSAGYMRTLPLMRGVRLDNGSTLNKE